MKRIIPLSLIALASMQAAEVKLESINVESTLVTEVSQKAQTSADLAQALSTTVPSIDMSRRSGIANDVFIRGQKRDNISVEVDGTKVCGACVNRMDPPISHVLASQIDEVEVIEGPYDVETFGTMSGGIKIKTKKPSKDVHGEMTAGMGSWDYKKIGFTVSGGNDTVRALVSATTETSGQYEDGDGNTIAEQVDNYAGNIPTLQGVKYQDKYRDMKAYTKNSVMAKVFVSVTDDQELRLSMTKNRSDDVLYGNSKMDAIYDDSNIYSVEYNVDRLTDTYSNLNLQYYYTDVDHPMATTYRKVATNPTKSVTNHLTTSMEGLKLKNTFQVAEHELLVGLDGSQRTWDGNYYKTFSGTPLGGSSKSIDDSKTDNIAAFVKVSATHGDFDVSLGARYDSTEITHATLQSNDYTALSANMFVSYNLNQENRIFFGAGQASRVPDARELYFRGSKGNQTGTPDLDQTTNREIDFGYETQNENFDFKIKAFYSMLSDYIYYNKSLKKNYPSGLRLPYHAFENIDATVYGAELSASVYATDDITVDMGASYKRGTKDEAMQNQTDTDLADMAPLRGNIALNYEYMNNSTATIELQASDKWSDIDSDNGEQELDAWSAINLKVEHTFNRNMLLSVGVNNLFDETYAASNTYADLILVTSGGSDDVMLMNEPGRYFYTNFTLKF
jgi:iron complex outermembrane receptor protein